jgi:hypothetical protein
MSAVPRPVSDRLLTDAAVRRTGRTRLVVGAIALAALVTLGTLGVALGGRPGPSVISVKDVDISTFSTTSTIVTAQPTPTSSTPSAPSTTTSATAPTSSTTTTTSTTSTTSTTTQTPTAPAPLDTLYSVLPPGYNSTLCTPSGNPSPQALATVDCGQLAGGPTSARFSLFADANALASQFQDGVDEDAVSQCPGSIDTPRSWHYDATPAFSAGSLACGSRNNVPDLTWTKNDVLLLGAIQGQDLDSLYGWWLSL